LHGGVGAFLLPQGREARKMRLQARERVGRVRAVTQSREGKSKTSVDDNPRASERDERAEAERQGVCMPGSDAARGGGGERKRTETGECGAGDADGLPFPRGRGLGKP
jgi:hypothetical protein